MPGISVGLLSRMPSIRVNQGRRIIAEPVTIDNLFSYTVNVADNQVVSPIFTFSDNAPRARVYFGDQTSSMLVTSGIEIPHTYRSRGIYTIRLLSPSQEVYLQQVDITDEPLIIQTYWDTLLELQALTRLHNQWYVGYGEVGIAKIVRGVTLPVPAWRIGFGVVGLFSIEIER